MPVFSLIFFFLTPGSHLFCNWNQHKQTIKSNCVMNDSYLGFKRQKKLNIQQGKKSLWGVGQVGWLIFNPWIYDYIIKHFHKKGFYPNISSDHQVVYGYMDGLGDRVLHRSGRHFILMDSRYSVPSLLFGASLLTS